MENAGSGLVITLLILTDISMMKACCLEREVLAIKARRSPHQSAFTLVALLALTPFSAPLTI
jgi:hypothetical protein